MDKMDEWVELSGLDIFGDWDELGELVKLDDFGELN